MKAKDVMVRASVTLLDEEFVRWPMLELAGYIDEAVKAIVSVKPSASSATMTLSLLAGTKQVLPTDSRIVQLLDIMRNLGTGGVGGRVIRSTSRASLDSNEPNWHNPVSVPFRKEVRQFVFDEILPLEYYVYPGNDGTGTVEAAVSKLPASVVDSHTGDAAVLSTWDIDVGIADIYLPPVIDYTLYRAFSKEDPAASPQRAITHFQAFATAIGLKSQVESSTSPGRKR